QAVHVGQQFADLVRRSGQSQRDRLRHAKAIQNSHVFLELYPEFVPCKQNGDLMEKLKHKNSDWNKPTKLWAISCLSSLAHRSLNRADCTNIERCRNDCRTSG